MQNTKAAAAAVTASFEQQLKVILQLRDAMASMSSNMEKMGQQTAGALSPDKWDEVSKKVQKTNTATKGATGAVAKMADVMQSKWTKAALVAQGALSGLFQGFKNLFALTKAATGFFGGVVKGLFNVGKAAIAIPFKIMSGLFKMASQGGGGTELAQAYENVRAAFGDLKGDVPQTIIGVAKSFDSMNQTGVSTTAIFGNMAQRLEAVNKLAQEMGPTFFGIQEEFKKNGVAMMTYQKGMGLTGEQMASVAQAANRMGTSSTKVLNDMAKQSLTMAKNFGIPAKVISKDMGKAMQDLAHFGHLSTKEIAVAATFANKLGVSVDKLTGIMDATSTFDQAAEGMSKLNQQFGTNIDATQIMMAQSGTEKIEMLRKEFARTGKDMSKLTMQERMLIKQSAGMDDAMLDAAFSAKNAGVSLDKISKAGDKSEKKTLSQAEAMQEMGKSIERAVVAGEKFASMFEAIISGIKKGIMSSPEFVSLMQNINVIMQKAFFFGMKLGKMFVDLFPGVKDVFGGLKEMFNPERFQKMFDGVLKAFDVFKVGGSGKMEDFMDQIQKVFLQFFSAGEPGGKKVLEGFKKFGGAVAQVFGMMSKWVIDKLSTIVDGITNWLKDPKIPSVNSGGLAGSLFGPFEGALKSLKEKLLPALKRLVSQLWDMLVESIKGMSTKSKMMIGGALAAVVLGPAIGQAITGLVSSKVFGKAGAQLSQGLAGAAAGASKDAAGAAQGAAAAMPAVSSSPAAMASSAIPDQKTIEQMETASKSKVDWPGLTKFLVGIAGMFTIGMMAFSKALDMVKGVAITDILKASLLFGAVATFMIPMAKAGEMLTNAKSMDWKALGQVLVGIGGMMLIGIAGFSLGILAVKALKVTMKDIGLAEVFMLAMIPPIAATGLLVAEALLVGKLVDGAKKEVLTGMVAMGIVLAAMVVAAAAVGGLTKLIGAAEMQAGANMMDVMANTFMKTGVIIGEATIIGAGIIATAGVGAVVAAAGLGAMAAAVVVMAETAGTILVQISQIPGDPNALKTKTEAFTLIMDSVGRMMGQIAGILKALDFGFFESEKSKIDKMNAAKGLINSLLNGEDGKGGINGILNTIVEGLKTLTPDKLETTKAFASVLNAVAGMMTAASKGAEGLQSKSIGWFTTAAEDQATIKASMEGAGGYIKTVMGAAGTLITSIVNSLSSVQDSGKFKEAGAALGSILQAVTGLITAIAPNIKDFHKESESSFSASAGVLGPNVSKAKKEAGVDGAGIAAAAAYMSTVMGAMSVHIPTMISDIMSGVGRELKKLDKRELDALPIVGDILKTVAGIVASITASTKGVGNVNINAAQGATVAIVNQIPSVSQIITDIGKSAPQLMSNFIGLTKMIPQDPTFKSKIETLSFIFDSINKMIQAVNTAVGGSTAASGQNVVPAEKENAIMDAMWAINNLLRRMTADWGRNPMQEIMGYLDAIGKTLPKQDSTKVLAEVFESISKITNAISSAFKGSDGKLDENAIMSGVDSMKKVLEKMSAADYTTALTSSMDKLWKAFTIDFLANVKGTETIVSNFSKSLGVITSTLTGGVADNISAIGAMVKKTQDLDDALSKLPEFKFPAKLQTIANGMGIGGKFAYSVQSKEVVINMHIDISMDVDKVEKVMITRHNSIIRDRINFGLENSSQKGKTDAYIKKTGDQGTNVATYNQ